jgi:hypothetical protein
MYVWMDVCMHEGKKPSLQKIERNPPSKASASVKVQRLALMGKAKERAGVELGSSSSGSSRPL